VEYGHPLCPTARNDEQPDFLPPVGPAPVGPAPVGPAGGVILVDSGGVILVDMPVVVSTELSSVEMVSAELADSVASSDELEELVPLLHNELVQLE